MIHWEQLNIEEWEILIQKLLSFSQYFVSIGGLSTPEEESEVII